MSTFSEVHGFCFGCERTRCEPLVEKLTFGIAVPNQWSIGFELSSESDSVGFPVHKEVELQVDVHGFCGLIGFGIGFEIVENGLPTFLLHVDWVFFFRFKRQNNLSMIVRIFHSDIGCPPTKFIGEFLAINDF